MKIVLLIAVGLLVTSCTKTIPSIQPCDVLVRTDPKPDTARYIVQNDRTFAIGVASNRERYKSYKCGIK